MGQNQPNLSPCKLQHCSPNCTTAQEVAAIPVPNAIGLVGFKSSVIFIPAPALRNAILALNTQDPFELIPLMSATARAFDTAHAND